MPVVKKVAGPVLVANQNDDGSWFVTAPGNEVVPFVTATQLPGGGVELDAGGVPIDLDTITATTDFPAEKVSLSSAGCACASPCQIERIRCVTGTSVAIVVYDNPAASAGTQLYSGTLSAGQEAAITTPIRAINGVRAVFASGSFDFYVSQEA